MDDFISDVEVVAIRDRHFHCKVWVQSGSLPSCESSSLSRLFFPFALVGSRLFTFCCGSDAVPSVCWQNWEKEWEASCDWSTARSRIQCGNSSLLCSHMYPQKTKSVLWISPLLLGGWNIMVFKVPSNLKYSVVSWIVLSEKTLVNEPNVSAQRNMPDGSQEMGWRVPGKPG